uniref:NADH-ubiquinone oxidoreductase chain 5 n=1 Tax=Tetrabrachium ocellatum TaxID=242972 RepID=D3KRE3_TETOC|nr:NADH dehydrogenase subunit 5 [Tetrabrachium ocellatum]
MLLSPVLIFSSAFIVSFILLFYPFVMVVWFKSSGSLTIYAKKAVFLAFVVMVVVLGLYVDKGLEAVLTVWSWMSFCSLDINLSFKLDVYSITFVPIALFVTFTIMEFATWYMEKDPDMDRFFKYLLLFLISMIILVTANNMFQLFIGWEGVGMMSFLLIGWWGARADANTAALEAVLYNRIGDVGLVFAMVWLAVNFGSWEMHQIFVACENMDLTMPLMGLVLAACGKSAQFGLHPWLPAAMEGPTPVSALLHSSTMVVAGIFLLVRISPLLQHNQVVLTTCLCLGGLTTLFTAVCALTQNDIKKIIAFSTSSQLGLMMVTIGLNQPQLAFLHICTHAFFKAMLFLCSGVIIHSFGDEQDIRKMGGIHKLLPITTSCLMVGSFALVGMPFLSGFFSKDAIIEALNTSYLNAWALFLTLLATAFTAVYSLRVVMVVSAGSPRFSPLPLFNENNFSVVGPIKYLAWGAILIGLVLTSHIIPLKSPVMTMSVVMKMAAVLVTIIGFLVALEVVFLTGKQFKTHSNSGYFFSSMLGFFPAVFHRFVPKSGFILSQVIASQIVDQAWLEKVGPKMVASVNVPLASIVSNLQRGVLKTYLMFSFLFLIFLMGFAVFV